VGLGWVGTYLDWGCLGRHLDSKRVSPIFILILSNKHISIAGLPGFFLIIELEKLSVVCPGSRTMGIAGNGAIWTVNRLIKRL